ncbi:hypothetical protein CLAFUW4_00926 [Fulvia fulva]|uniref:SnoaL-like domain-containing protein n=1 Tax=Passalora fulva TaxID=5499 RepID=A0A9Q8L669_PASFU|nr:uncharacterized protein CLAFUR5_00931 [Fulvia fulva]KAK4634814.1 hypothetical protein CLAFUR4_00927 [Fulvia fulva]KAK4638573.1 hypothetical protein CLAFUR0_00927 [Fulvia fulva]UJO11600.1 hypothetical protein CLAFUR5_00931 [Fulvia fulva]WPV09419.1 hypothetical protein CLAFUW4_00926 [Fulvia fulva]WPV24451.1 hypothetical protein CLAFUW7_00890 [Fulvia fulva]
MTGQDLYTTLESTATDFITSLSPGTAGSNNPNPVQIMSNMSPDFRSDFGHRFFVSTKPHLQGRHGAEHFVNRMAFMAVKLETWKIDTTDVVVDERKKSVMVKSDFHMIVRGGKAVVNEIVFLLGMDESGQEIVNATEFVDAEAASEIARLMQGGGQ